MKTRKSIFITLVSLIIVSCAPSNYYQIYKATPVSNLISNENSLVYENDNCKVSYNLWSDGGNIGFSFYNKTDQNIFLDLEQSFYILNGKAFNYYKNRIFTISATSGIASSRIITDSNPVSGFNYLDFLQANSIKVSSNTGLVTSAGSSVSYNEEKIICIPSKSSKIISEYGINNSLYRDCDLFKYPSSKEIKSKSFTKNNSPIIFSNRITYFVGQSESLIKFENEFFVSEITNYPENEITESKYEVFCGEKGSTLKTFFKDVAPNKFYFKYEKGFDSGNH